MPIVGFLASLVVTFAAGSGQAWGQGGTCGVTAPALNAAIATGASHLAAVQLADGGWEWPLGGGMSYPNQFGVEGLGLLDGYARTSDPALLAAAVRTGEFLVTKYNAQSPKQRAYTTDVEFLVALGAATGNVTYGTTAVAWFGVTMTQYPNPAARVDAILTGRGIYRTMAAWDVASFIRAAKAVGQTAYATGAANRIVQREISIVEGGKTLPGWKDTDPSHRWDQCLNPDGCGFTGNLYSYDFTILGEGALLEAFQGLSGFEAKVTEYRTFLLSQQDPNGAWDAGDSQITAFVMRGLASTADVATKSAMTAGTCFFLSLQLPTGGWPSYEGAPVEYPEIDSEILSALALVRIPVVTVTGGTFPYDGLSHAATAVAVGGDGIAVAGTFSFAYTPGGPDAPVGFGTYAVAVRFSSSDGNYLDAAGEGSVSIEKATPAVTVTGGTFTYDGFPHPATATAAGTSGGSVAGTFLFAYAPGGAAAPVVVGSYDVTVGFTSSDPNYADATGTGSVVVKKAPSTVAVICPASVIYTGSAIEVCSATVTGAGGLSQAVTPVTYTTNTNVGTAGTSATYAGDANHNGSTGTGSFAIVDTTVPGDMHGNGSVTVDTVKYQFDFQVSEDATKKPNNRFELRVHYDPKSKHENYRFVATTINPIIFSDGFTGPKKSDPLVDTVVFSGTVVLKGDKNTSTTCSFTVNATDRGEPGKKVGEVFGVKITGGTGCAVDVHETALSGGNIQSKRVKH